MQNFSPTPLVDSPQAVTLESAYQQGDHYAVIAAALAHLQADPDSAEAAIYAFRSYAALGLVAAALEMLEPGRTPLAGLPDFGPVEEQLRCLPSDVISWETLRPRFEANTKRLYAAHPHLRPHDATFRSLADTAAIHRSLDGNLHLAMLSPGGLRAWTCGMIDARQMAAETKPAHPANHHYCNPYVIAGDVFAALFRRIHDLTKDIFLSFTPRLYLLETDPRAFGAAIWVLESIEPLCEARVSIVVGDNAIEEFAELLRANERRIVPEYVTALPVAGGVDREALVTKLQSIVTDRIAATERTAGQNDAHYEALPPDHWRRRFSSTGGEPLRILGLTSRFTTVLQYAMRDLSDAFESLGHRMHIQIEDNDHDAISPTCTVKSIAEFKPDLVFLIDHLRREYPGVFPRNLPFACWAQDLLPHLMCREAGESMGPLDFFIAPDVLQFSRIYGYPPRRGLMSTMVTNDRLYSPEPLPADVLARYRCDFSYISNQAIPPELLEGQRRRMLPADARVTRLLDFLHAELNRRAVESPDTLCHAATPLMDAAKLATGVEAPSRQIEEAIIRLYVQPLADLLYRQKTLEWVAEYCKHAGRTLHLYGNGWENHPRFSPYARGVAGNGEELRAIHQATAINLQCNSFGAIHQRLLDGLASGGFFLLRTTSSDLMGPALRAFFASVEKYGFEAERPYARADVPELAVALDELVSLDGQPDPGDPICLPQGRMDSYRALAAGDYSRVAGEVFECYADVAFDSAASFAAMADRFLTDADARAEIAGRMRNVVQKRFTYRALASALLNMMSICLSDPEAA